MADFSRYSNYTEETAFSSVVFGANAPVLEVELNEMQQILNNKIGGLLESFGDVLIPLKGHSVECVLDSTEAVGDILRVNVKECLAVCKGNPFYIKDSRADIVYSKKLHTCHC